MRILFIGDVVGRAGKRVLAAHFDRVVDRYRIDFSIANVENAADGSGVTPDLAQEFLALGINCLTSGNHIWDKREITTYISGEPRSSGRSTTRRSCPGRVVSSARHRAACRSVSST